MKRVSGILALALVAALAPLALAALAPLALAAPAPPVQKTLANGLRVVVFPRPGTGFVQVQLSLEAGTAAEGADQRGAAPLVTQMLKLGTSSRSAEAFAEDFRQLGGGFVATASRENAAIGAAFLPGDLDAGLELLSDAVINPIFNPDAFERTRAQAVRELVRLHSDPIATTDEQLWPFALPGVPAARPPLGDLASLFALTREAVRNFHRDAYRPDRAVLALAGDVTADRAFDRAGEWFGRWSGQAAAPRAASAAGPGEGTHMLLVDQPDLPVAAVRFGWRLPGREASDDLARTVGVSLCGEALESRLAGRLPGEAGLAMGLGQVHGASLVDVHLLTPADSAAAVIDRVRRAVKQVRDAPIDGARLAELQQQVRAAYPMRFATLGGGLAQWLTAAQVSGDPDGALASYPARVAALDPAAVAAALKREWNLDRTAIVVVGPAARLRGPLARLGAVEEVKLDQPPAAGPADTLAAPTAVEENLGRERIAKALAAHGGLDKLRAVHDMVSEARIRLVIEGRELRGELRQIRKEPLKMVYLTSFESFESRQVLNGNRAWSVTATGQIQDADSAGVRALQSGYSSDVAHLLVTAADPTTQVADRGVQRLGDQDLWAIDMVPRSGQRRRLYLDPKTSRLVAMDQNEESARSARLTARRLYRDLRDVDGVLLPFEEERQLDGRTVMQVFVTRLQINGEISNSEFERPASVPAAPKTTK